MQVDHRGVTARSAHEAGSRILGLLRRRGARRRRCASCPAALQPPARRSTARDVAPSSLAFFPAVGRAFRRLALTLLAACSGKGRPGPAPAGAMPPPPSVGVVTVAPQVVALQAELPGRVEPLRVAQVRARVNGVVLERQFVEGSEVRAGQALFLIDPAPYQAALDSASAQLARARPAWRRPRPRPTGTGRWPKPEPSAIRTTSMPRRRRRAPRPTWLPAAPRCRRLASTWAMPSHGADRGRIGRALVTEGALVSAAEATQLALIQQTRRCT